MTEERAAGGDSGGPVAAVNEDGTFVLIGLVSFGPPEVYIPPIFQMFANFRSKIPSEGLKTP